jgi:CheY-like chemotaxis protein
LFRFSGSFYLQAKMKMSEQDTNSPMNDSGRIRYKKLLLIEDDKVDRYISERIIREADFSKTIEVMYNAKEAIQYLKNLPSGELPEIIFLDIDMAGMTGFDFLDEFQNLDRIVRKYCSIFILTNFPENKLLKSFLTNNFSIEAILGKPLDAEALRHI